jgi:hypothetical protein
LNCLSGNKSIFNDKGLIQKGFYINPGEFQAILWIREEKRRDLATEVSPKFSGLAAETP